MRGKDGLIGCAKFINTKILAMNETKTRVQYNIFVLMRVYGYNLFVAISLQEYFFDLIPKVEFDSRVVNT